MAVQAYYSDRDKAFIIPDGNSYDLYLNPQYDAANTFLRKYTLTRIDGHHINDTMKLASTISSDGSVQVTLNSKVLNFDDATNFNYDSMQGITIHSPGGDDTIIIDLSNGDFGSDQLDIHVNVGNQSGDNANTLVVNEGANSHGWGFYKGEIDSGLDGSGQVIGIHYSNIQYVFFNGGSGNDNYSIFGTETAVYTEIDAGGGKNSFVVGAGIGNLIDLPQWTHPDGTTGFLTLNGGSGSSSLVVDDQNNAVDPKLTDYRITRKADDPEAEQIVREDFNDVGAVAPFGVTFKNFAQVKLNTNHDNKFFVQSPPAGTTGITLDINAGAGNNTIEALRNSWWKNLSQL